MKKLLGIIRVHSEIDVITNSSSEIYVIGKNGGSLSQLQENFPTVTFTEINGFRAFKKHIFDKTEFYCSESTYLRLLKVILGELPEDLERDVRLGMLKVKTMENGWQIFKDIIKDKISFPIYMVDAGDNSEYCPTLQKDLDTKEIDNIVWYLG